MANPDPYPISWSQAYANDPQVAASQRNVEIADLDKKMNLAVFQKPSVSGNALALWAPGTKLWGFDKAITNGGEYDAFLNITYPLWQGSNLKAYNKMSLSQSKQASYNVMFRKHNLKRQVTQSYVRIYGDQQQMAYLDQLDQLLQQQLKQWSGLVSGGLLKVTDVQQVRLEDQQVRIQQKQAQNQFKQDQSAINQLCGISDTSGYKVTHPGLNYPAGSPDVQQSNFLRSFRHRQPEFRSESKSKGCFVFTPIGRHGQWWFVIIEPGGFLSSFWLDRGIAAELETVGWRTEITGTAENETSPR